MGMLSWIAMVKITKLKQNCQNAVNCCNTRHQILLINLRNWDDKPFCASLIATPTSLGVGGRSSTLANLQKFASLGVEYATPAFVQTNVFAKSFDILLKIVILEKQTFYCLIKV